MTLTRRRLLPMTRRLGPLNAVLEHGVILGLYPNTDPSFGVELQRKNNGSTAWNTIYQAEDTYRQSSIEFTDYLPNDNLSRSYRARHVKTGWTAGSWTDTVVATPAELPDQTRDGGRDGLPRLSNVGIPVSLRLTKTDGTYSQPHTVTVRSGASTAASHSLLRHRESGIGQDGDSVSFSVTYENPPLVTFVPQSAKTYSSASGDAQFIDMRTQNLTATGFTLRAKLIYGSTGGTDHDEGWSTAQGGVSTGQGDKTMENDGTHVYCRLEDATTEVVEYEAYYDVDADEMDDKCLATMALYYNASTGSTSWTLCDSKSYDNISVINNERLSANLALKANRDLRLSLTYSSTPTATATMTAHGSENAVPGVQFTVTTGGGTEESMTPNEDNKIAWTAIEAPS